MSFFSRYLARFPLSRDPPGWGKILIRKTVTNRRWRGVQKSAVFPGEIEREPDPRLVSFSPFPFRPTAPTLHADICVPAATEPCRCARVRRRRLHPDGACAGADAADPGRGAGHDRPD